MFAYHLPLHGHKRLRWLDLDTPNLHHPQVIRASFLVQFSISSSRFLMRVFFAGEVEIGMHCAILDIQWHCTWSICKVSATRKRAHELPERKPSPGVWKPLVQMMLQRIRNSFIQLHDPALTTPSLGCPHSSSIGVKTYNKNILQSTAAHLPQIPFFITCKFCSTHGRGGCITDMRIVRPNSYLDIFHIKQLLAVLLQAQKCCHHMLIPGIPRCSGSWWLQLLLRIILVRCNHALQVLLAIELVQLRATPEFLRAQRHTAHRSGGTCSPRHVFTLDLPLELCQNVWPPIGPVLRIASPAE
mmetsp:Transcript_23561/g.42873  ORF Transcript_23561/g.42873 Transcript_23561/m.42873 type:complete len:300 (+) Transcript_23561:56-955(+)